MTFALERKVFFGVGVLILALALLYTYFVAFSIAYVVEREELSHKAAVVSEEAVRLEKRYLERSQGITELSARSLGLVPAESRIFVERQTLSLRDGE